MVIEETRDLAETADCVVIEAILVDDGLRYRQLSVGIKDEHGPHFNRSDLAKKPSSVKLLGFLFE